MLKLELFKVKYSLKMQTLAAPTMNSESVVKYKKNKNKNIKQFTWQHIGNAFQTVIVLSFHESVFRIISVLWLGLWPNLVEMKSMINITLQAYAKSFLTTAAGICEEPF